MTVKEIRERIEEIEKVSFDDEACHRLEDVLYEDVLRHIAQHPGLDAWELAEAALKTKQMEFARWCA